MNNSLQVVNQNQDLTSQFTPKELELITHTIAKGATPEELQLFLYRCKLLKLNPMKPGQIHFIKYGQGPGTIVVGIEGFRSTAGRTGKHVSTNRGVLKDANGSITYGWARVKRRDQTGEIQEYYEETPIEEYYKDTNPSWKKMPQSMIKKCAEAAALRMAYPDDLGGLYIPEELDNVDQPPQRVRIAPDQPNADDGCAIATANQPYSIKFGKMAKRTFPDAIKAFGIEALMKAVELCEAKLAKNELYANVTKADMEEFIRLASAAIAAFERGEMFDADKPSGFVVKPDPYTFKSDEEDVPF